MRRCVFAALACLALPTGAPRAGPVTPTEVVDRVLDLTRGVGEYTRASPEAPGAFAAWAIDEVRVGEPLLVHRYPELQPSYFIVPVLGRDATPTSFVTVDAMTGAWHGYWEVGAGSAFPAVSAARAAGVASRELGRRCEPEEFRAVSMPNKIIYWYAEVGGREVFVSLWDPLDLRLGLDEDLTTPMNPARAVEPEPSGSLPPETPRPRYPVSHDIENVPHYYQATYYNCGPASAEMIFDYWGPHIGQADIASVANTTPDGTAATDMRRACHFSFRSVAIGDPDLYGYVERDFGYSANENQWSFPDTTDPEYPDRYDDLKNLISSDYPLMLLTHFDETGSSGHFRVLKGYDDNTDVFIVHDPWYAPPYQGPNVHFNQAFLVDTLWDRFHRWALFTAPWEVEHAIPATIPRGREFTVSLDVTYTGPHPFEGDYTAAEPEAALIPTNGFWLPPGEVSVKPLPTIGAMGTSASVSWQVRAPCHSSPGLLHLLTYGEISGWAPSYGSYTDRIGKAGKPSVQASTNPNIIYVEADGGWDYLTIQDGIDNAPCEGDWVAVLPDTYKGTLNRDLDFGGRNLVVFGSDPSTTVIDCENAGRGFHFHGGEDTTSVVSGLTIRHGKAPGTYGYGGGVYCFGASPRFASIVVEDCDAAYGGGMAWFDGSLVIEDALVWNNTASQYGGGLFCSGDSLGRIEQSEILGNIAGLTGGGIYSGASANILRDVTIQANVAGHGGGVYLAESAPLFERALIEGNTSERGAGMYIRWASTPEIRSTTFANNDAGVGLSAVECDSSWPTITRTIVSHTVDGAGISCVGGGYPDISHSCVYGNAGGDSLCGPSYHDNLFGDPLYCDPPLNDYALHDDSPCLPANNPWGELIGRYAAGGCGPGTGVGDGDELVRSLVLRPPSPNPAGGRAALEYSLPESDAELTASVYSVSGRLVRVLFDGPAEAGPGTLVWDGRDAGGREVASGVYFIRVAFGPDAASRKLVVIR
jgi:hypothetical protein